MRAILIVFLLTSVSLAQVEYGSFEHDGYLREYITYLPPGYEPGLPVVLSLHGLSYTPQWQMDNTYMHLVADTANFVVCYPGGVENAWSLDLDHVGFIDKLIDTLSVTYAIDLERVYACGWSAGAWTTLLLGCELQDRLAKIGPVSILVPRGLEDNYADISPIPVCYFMGTDDFVHNFTGENQYFPFEEGMALLMGMNGCQGAVDSLLLPDMDITDDTRVEVFRFTDCNENGDFLYYKIHGGGHWWPGTPQSMEGLEPFYDFDDASQEIIADVELWHFFSQDTVEFHGVWVGDLWINTSFGEPGVGTLSIGAALTNTDDHNYTAFALVFDADSSIVDSVQLFDDGEHDDGIANDGIAGAFLTAPTNESFFYVQATATDIEASKYLGLHDFAQFTTAGPISFTGVDLPPSDPVPNPGDYLSIYIHLMNAGNVLELSNITASLSTQDTFVVSLSDYNRSFGNIAPGDTARSNFTYSIRIAEDCPDYHDIPIQVKIFTDGYPYWTDEFIFQVQPVVGISAEAVIIPSEYNLEQNFPNPFNPTTSISYDLPETSDLRLTIYDITGRTVATLADVHQPAGSYTTQWNGSDDSGNPVSTGVYFCRLQARDYSKTIKMVYLK
jgi:poly(3-hydroxybutyrate) depolymerase